MRPECELCGASFQQQTELEAHMRHRHVEDVPFNGTLFECGNCERSYPARDDLDLHVQRKHTV